MKRDFLFSNNSRAMHGLLNEIVSFIKNNIPPENNEQTISKCKQILIELLTNAVKHSDTDTSTFSVTLADNRIEITKSDVGRRFYLDNYTGWPPLKWPLQEQFVGEKIKIYTDDISQLYAVIQNDSCIVFELLEYPIESLTRDSVLLEHYGLLILTKLSDEFFYFYDSATNSNLFRSVINHS